MAFTAKLREDGIVGGEYSIIQQKTKKTFTFNLGEMTCKALQA